MDISQVKNKSNHILSSEGSRYRKLLSIITQNNPKNIVIGDWDGKGDLTFSISMTDIGLQYKDYNFYEDEFFSYFVINFLGELIVRENLQLFVEKLKEYDINDYMTVIEEYGDHKCFGVKTYKGRLIFKFHVSLLKNILTENLRESLG
jgi:hypothetical protein